MSLSDNNAEAAALARLGSVERGVYEKPSPEVLDPGIYLLASQTAHGFTAGQVVRWGNGSSGPLSWDNGSIIIGGDPAPPWVLASIGQIGGGILGIITQVLGPDRFRVLVGGIGKCPALASSGALSSSDLPAPGWFLGMTAGTLMSYGYESNRVAWILPDSRLMMVGVRSYSERSGVYQLVRETFNNASWHPRGLLDSYFDASMPYPYGSDAASSNGCLPWFHATINPLMAGQEFGEWESLGPGTVGQVLTMVTASGTYEAPGALKPAWQTISPATLGAVPTARTITAGSGLTGGGDLSADRTLAIAASGVSAGSYGSTTTIPVLTIGADGRVTAATTASISTTPDTVLGVSSNGWIKRTGVNTYAANTTIPWGDLSSVPSTFAPSAHTHDAGDITTGTLGVARGGTGAATLTGYVKGAGTAALTASATVPWSDLSGVPATFAPSAHTHAASDITSGTLGVARGGTGIASYAVGDLPYASASTTLAVLSAVAVGKALVSKGTSTAPAWETLTPSHLATTAGFALWAKTTTGAGAMTEVTALEGQVLALKASGAIRFTYSPQLGKNGVSAGSQTIYTASTKNSFWITSAAGTQFFEAGDTTAAFEITHDTSGITSLVMRRRTGANTFSHVVSINMADLASLTGSPANQTIRLREIDECDSTGAAKKRLYLCSAQY